jgi:hypothetical protein
MIISPGRQAASAALSGAWVLEPEDQLGDAPVPAAIASSDAS